MPAVEVVVELALLSSGTGSNGSLAPGSAHERVSGTSTVEVRRVGIELGRWSIDIASSIASVSSGGGRCRVAVSTERVVVGVVAILDLRRWRRGHGVLVEEAGWSAGTSTTSQTQRVSDVTASTLLLLKNGTVHQLTIHHLDS